MSHFERREMIETGLNPMLKFEPAEEPAEEIAVFSPGGWIVPETVCRNRKHARQGFSRWTGLKWNELWKQGFRVGRVFPRTKP